MSGLLMLAGAVNPAARADASATLACARRAT
jgi:hypothetical protein